MSDSDSDLDLSSSTPTDSVIAKTLCQCVISFFKADDLDALTLKRVRSDAADKLGLPDDFFKTDARWKDKSKDVVSSEVSRQEAKNSESSSSPDVPKKRAAPSKRSQSPLPAASRPKPKASTRRKSAEPKPRTRKRQKTASSSISDDNLTPLPESDSIKADSEEATAVSAKSPIPSPQNLPVNGDNSESELSVLLDEPPAPKGKRKKSASSEKTEKSSKGKGTKAKSDATSTPQEEEIKRLQGWLIKCGIRKLWGKELAQFSTRREKISHLKGLLRDAGMGGRYSEEKARQIKEERELKADLEDIQERERKWGQDSGDEEKIEGRPRRKLARGLRELQAFAGDDEESE